jgi:hypothetical protein
MSDISAFGEYPDENLSGEIQIGNTQRMTHETYLKFRKKLDEFIFKKKLR